MIGLVFNDTPENYNMYVGEIALRNPAQTFNTVTPTIKQVAKENGAYATYLSGAGPTVMVLASHDKMPTIKAELEKQPFKGKLHGLKVDTQGVRVEAK